MTQTLLDLKTFVNGAGYASPTVSTVATGTSRAQAKASSLSYTAEWDIDSQNALGAAGGVVKSLVFYVANSAPSAPPWAWRPANSAW